MEDCIQRISNECARLVTLQKEYSFEYSTRANLQLVGLLFSLYGTSILNDSLKFVFNPWQIKVGIIENNECCFLFIHAFSPVPSVC